MGNGNITKIANGHMQETAKQEYTSFAKTIQSNAAQKVTENSKDGIVYGEPQQMKYTTVDGIDIIAGVFFDGTLNNMTNTKNHDTGKNEGSYGNDLSNVARLLAYYKESDKIIKTYTEGIGTTNLDSDDTTGSGFGAGRTGIPKKVLKGCQQLADRVIAKATKKKVNTLTIDVFGFSRGAAAARNFIYEVTQSDYPSYQAGTGVRYDIHGQVTTLERLPKGGELGKLLLNKGVKVTNIIIRFVGLFDTVSSFNKSGFAISPDFSNDVGELHLDRLFKAEKVIHFTAENEHRKYFALTRIQSAGKKGIEKELPGVHSDIGGSYPDETEYVDEILNGGSAVLEAEKNRLIAEGWYLEEQLELHSVRRKLSGTRALKKNYSYIPLHFMSEFGLKEPVPLPFDQVGVEGEYKLTYPLLDGVKKKLHGYVFGKELPYKFMYYKQLIADYNAKKISAFDYNTALTEQKNLRLLRNQFLHWSANYDGIGGPFQPNMENNVRKRIPYEG
ncbi:hypothetical protein HDE69_005121 [Pedobacter cryoconitis]|uniref:T6SS Phospholipase effector Tle1-like catalytic domain-containing protein n=1 Tax=Pedobacter cryoconitis TaxID=188932 RepID=A0A7W9DMJ9_9SPHI|nr:DUF2235 domain-containing protein [Pedobacter cryoconitis]MBB5624024.1 hypothetical protein [Pedobacter cryoconitis]